MPTDMSDVGANRFHGEIVAVVNVDEYFGCIVCKAKVQQQNSIIGECSKCRMKVKMTKCALKQVAIIVSCLHHLVLFMLSSVSLPILAAVFMKEDHEIKGWPMTKLLSEEAIQSNWLISTKLTMH